jgi:hypothetical protein
MVTQRERRERRERIEIRLLGKLARRRPYHLVPRQPITLVWGRERDCKYLRGVFTEVWSTIPDVDKVKILSRDNIRGITIFVTDDIPWRLAGQSDSGGEIKLNRAVVDFHPRAEVVRVVSHELAHKVDDAEHFDFHTITQDNVKELGMDAQRVTQLGFRIVPRRNVERRVATILRRWGYPAKPDLTRTEADKERRREVQTEVYKYLARARAIREAPAILPPAEAGVKCQ